MIEFTDFIKPAERCFNAGANSLLEVDELTILL